MFWWSKNQKKLGLIPRLLKGKIPTSSNDSYAFIDQAIYFVLRKS